MLALGCCMAMTASAQFGPRGGRPQEDLKSLKEAYKDYFMIGVAVNQRNIANPDEVAIITREYNSMTAENDMKPGEVCKGPGQYDWSRADKIADFARKHGIKPVSYTHLTLPTKA